VCPLSVHGPFLESGHTGCPFLGRKESGHTGYPFLGRKPYPEMAVHIWVCFMPGKFTLVLKNTQKWTH